MSDRSTKERILDAAEGLMLEKSFHSVGLNEILKAVKVPKGSFYHHFESKEQFGVEMLRHYVAESTAYKSKLLLSPTPEPDPLLRLVTYLESNVCRTLESEGKCPCLVIKLASEVADFSEPMREVLAQGTREWVAIFEKLLIEGVQKGKMATSIEPTLMAPVILDLWTGAMHRASTTRSVTALREAITFLKSTLSPHKI
ncbi:TetR/AcrR family transcriptional regulator [Prosthecobacter dejongeii]|uniref:TetR/AcrR family transcriptional repressor of nem operon n=1 Tax=Prosthecobacter dejongeii TaxID=48465 RepID=A0A7W7YI66_9BACT|nr:TetR/AcrR family transcriptional regulator [Prosthecobacter dejongeii]MBB5036579.1 TetR/AcrR family transcriptional repressor of nem operon [Prosthecobacter dejongeii]